MESTATDTQRLDLDRLPATAAFRVVLEAQAPQRLAPLFTTAVHGALGHALRDLVCVVPGRPPCAGCPHAAGCAVPGLLEPQAREPVLGVTGRGAPAIVLAPETPVPAAPRSLEAGERVALRVTLIGARALGLSPLLTPLFARVAERGLALGGTPRPPLALASVAPEAPAPTPPGDALALELVTPARLARGGRIASDLDADLLWAALVRRGDVLARLHGGGALTDGPAGSAPFALAAERLRVQDVPRYSSRQRRRMVWPGLVGRLVLRGPGLDAARPLLAFGEQVQLGKATGFGFGRYRLGAA